MAALVVIEAVRDAERPRIERIFRERTEVLDSSNDFELISKYWFPRNSIIELIELIKNDVARPTSRCCALPVHIQNVGVFFHFLLLHVFQVLATLRFLAKGNFQSETGDIHGISQSSVNVCLTLCRRLDNINFPEGAADLRSIKGAFYNICGFPNVVGALDGTLISIQGMAGDDEKIYVCRKGYHSLNIQGVEDANMRFLNINCKFPGSTHDAFILASSGVSNIMENLPEGGWLVGDSGYPLKTWLMTRLTNPQTQQETRYNNAHCKTRTAFERSFGVLKSRFRCIHKTGGALAYSPLKCAKIIETAFRLHSKAIEDRIPVLHGGEVVNRCHNDILREHAQGNAQNIRARLIYRF
ncbi:putative nuclease HARBI1 [Gigantopelta aegis]|uniref:putative nuclease HARBI1 n=1 Tax=Gigantopelta aegis TaxID=1735272 RepID=UPI001B88AE44|nr:putative nuclease HARBI1 [Gigantopelta aegis]